MPLVHDTPVNVGSIFIEIQTNLYDAKLKWFTEEDILDSLQESYNKLVALLCPIEHSTFIPKVANPYYNLAGQIPDYMYLSGIYNPTINQWLTGQPYKLMKNVYQTYLCIGEPQFFNVTDLRRVLLWPFPSAGSGVLYVVFKAKAPIISLAHIPVLPYSCASQLLEYFTTADLFEQAREFTKASKWWDRIFKPVPGQRNLYEQAQAEIKSLARSDRELVLEPYRWIFHGGTLNTVSWINNETPTGTINGTNASFTLAQVPSPTASLVLTKNGMVQYEGTAYTLSGQTITYASGYIPQVGDQHRAWYQIA